MPVLGEFEDMNCWTINVWKGQGIGLVGRRPFALLLQVIGSYSPLLARLALTSRIKQNSELSISLVSIHIPRWRGLFIVTVIHKFYFRYTCLLAPLWQHPSSGPLHMLLPLNWASFFRYPCSYFPFLRSPPNAISLRFSLSI